MQNEKMFELNSTTFSNIESIFRDVAALHELSVCELSFAASQLASDIAAMNTDGVTVNEATSLLSEEMYFSKPIQNNEKKELAAVNSKSFVSAMSNLNKAVFASLLNEKLGELGITVSESDYLPAIETEETFTYVKNSLSDEAFDVFSQEFSDPRIVYSDSFKDACIKVSDGKVGYCILPFEEKGGARINSILSLISSFDLKIVAITPVFGFEGNADMKYALVGRGFVIPQRDDATDRYLEISIGRNAPISLAELISAAEYLSISVFSVDTSIDISSDSELTYTLILKDESKSFADFLTYLNIFAGSYIPVGIYKNIE